MSDLLAIIVPGATECLIILGMIVTYAIPILVVVWFARRTIENKRENVRLRLEVGKLAAELEQIRKQRQAG